MTVGLMMSSAIGRKLLQAIYHVTARSRKTNPFRLLITTGAVGFVVISFYNRVQLLGRPRRVLQHIYTSAGIIFFQ